MSILTINFGQNLREWLKVTFVSTSKAGVYILPIKPYFTKFETSFFKNTKYISKPVVSRVPPVEFVSFVEYSSEHDSSLAGATSTPVRYLSAAPRRPTLPVIFPRVLAWQAEPFLMLLA